MSEGIHIEISLKVQFGMVVALSANVVSWTKYVVKKDTSSLFAAVVARIEMPQRLQSSSEFMLGNLKLP
ncbi:MAG TPA: hypothetical protein DDE71_10025 [Tenacibaculum sp.]|nr:hypothetical protein [Tenacibaculum sp.]